MHFYQLVQDQFYDDSIFFRVLPWVAQFGLPLPGHKLQTWGKAGILDDRIRVPIRRGMLIFDNHGGKKNRRATQALFLTGDHKQRPGWAEHSRYAPFGEVVNGMEIIDALHQHEVRRGIAVTVASGKQFLLHYITYAVYTGYLTYTHYTHYTH
jgi:cyclophilin family peptidyl-prolyl cis-trans isomerase